MIRITLSVITGVGAKIFVDSYFHSTLVVVWIMGALLTISIGILLALFFIGNTKSIYAKRYLSGATAIVSLISFGYLHTWIYTDINFPAHFKNHLRGENFMVAKVSQPPLEKTKSVIVIGDVKQVVNAVINKRVHGRIQLHLALDSNSKNLEYGDVIVFNSSIKEFEEPKNPEEFSYKLYQSFHNIHHHAFLKNGDWTLLQSDGGNPVWKFVFRVREYFLSIIQTHVKDKNDFAVASAIMLGYRDFMNADVIQAYSSAGALHVLCVSGLHVGIMFLILNSLFSVMDKMGGRWLLAKGMIIILIIWFYACLTGLSPSVFRSAMMFSMIQVGQFSRKHVNIYNIIFGSALLLILFNPYIITEVGFKLSYLAVLGIIYIYPKIYPLLVIGLPAAPQYKSQKNYLLKPFTFLRHDLKWFAFRVLDLGWQIVAVSVSAQIATGPLSVFYFHQFPVLFLISNLVVIPISNVLLFLGTCLMAFGEIRYITTFLGWCFDTIISKLNQFIFFVDNVPFSLIQGISINMFEMIIQYVILLFSFLFYETRKAKWLINTLALVAGLSVFNAIETLQQEQQRMMVVYAVPKQHGLAFIDGVNVKHDFDEKLLQDASSLLFHVRHHWWKCGLKRENSAIELQNKDFPFGKFFVFAGKKILVLDTTLEKFDFEQEHKFEIDLVILSHNAKVYLKNLQKVIEFKVVVFDSSNKPSQINHWKKDCEEMELNYYDVSADGAYIQDFGSNLPFFNVSSLFRLR